MTKLNPTVLVANLPLESGLIWQAIFKLQKLDVIWEEKLPDLYEYIKLIRPDVMLINFDINRQDSLNPGVISRWCQTHMRNMHVFLVDTDRVEIDELQRRWAKRRGAVDVLPKLTRTNALTSINLILRTIDRKLDDSTLPILLKLLEKDSPEVVEIAKDKEEATQETNQTTEEQFIIYRGVKVPKFSVASPKYANLRYRILPVKIDQDTLNP